MGEHDDDQGPSGEKIIRLSDQSEPASGLGRTGGGARRLAGSGIDLRVVPADETADDDMASVSAGTPLAHWSEKPSGASPQVSGPAHRSRWGRYSQIWGTGNDGASLDELRAASGLGSDKASEGGDVDRTEDAPKSVGQGSGREPSEKTETVRGSSSLNDARARAVALKSSPSLLQRTLTAGAVAVTALAAFLAGPVYVLVLATAVIFLCAIEALDGFRRVGYRPVTFLALLGVVGVMVGAYVRGATALPLMLTLVTLFTFLWFLVGASRAAPSANIAVTVLAFVWTGVLGSFTGLLLRMPDDRGMAFLAGAVITTVVYDVSAYLGGSVLGRRPLASTISPNKTWEGLIVGTLVATLVGAFGVSAISPWGVASGVLLGVVVSCVAPLGDLAESMVKRDLGLKDMGRLLPGHGGALDRFDGMLFVLPATYYLVLMLNLN